MIVTHETISYGVDLDCPGGNGEFCTGKTLDPMKRIELQKDGNKYGKLNVSQISHEMESPPCFGDAGKIYVQ